MENSSDPLMEELRDRSNGIRILECTVIVILNLLSFGGNMSVCWIIYNCRNLRTVPNLFVLSLAITDICVSVLVMPFTFTTLLSDEWILGTALCKMQGYCMLTLGMISLQTLTGIAVNRYFAIVKSIEYKHVFTRRRTLTFLVSIWFLSCSVCMIPILLKSSAYAFFPGKAACFFPFEVNLAVTLSLEIVFIGLPLNIMLFCYYKVFREVRRTKRRINVGWRENTSNPGPSREELRVTQTLAFVLVGFCTCWIPVSVIDFLDLYHGGPAIPRQVYFMYSVLLYCSSTINPLIYGLSSRKFRIEYSKIFGNCRSRFRDGNTTNDSLNTAEGFKVPEVVIQTASTGLDIVTSHDLHLDPPRATLDVTALNDPLILPDVAKSHELVESPRTCLVQAEINDMERPRTMSDIATSYDFETDSRTSDVQGPSSYDLL